MSVQVLAIDPGKTTGIVLAECFSPMNFNILQAFDLKWADRLRWLTDDFPTVDYVVIESFNLFAHKAAAQIGSDFPAVNMIGAVELRVFSDLAPIKLVTQTPSQRVRAIILDHHKARFTGVHHAKDAYKHLRVFISNPKNKVFS